MANTNIFDAQEFFTKTAYYASQGRSLFRLTERPKVLSTNQNDPLVDTGWKLLTTGLMAKSVTLAGYNMATFEEFSYIGPTRKHAHTQLFGPITVEFFLMGQSLLEAQAIHHTFLVWQEKIAGARFASDEVDRGARSDSTFFALAYYDDYVCEAEVEIFAPTVNGTTNTLQAVIHNKYREIWPQALGGLSPSWESPDAPLTLSVTFEFFHTNSLIKS